MSFATNWLLDLLLENSESLPSRFFLSFNIKLNSKQTFSRRVPFADVTCITERRRDMIMSSLFESVRRSTFRRSASTSAVGLSQSPTKGNCERDQEIDYYRLKQTARNTEDYDLEQKIDLEIKMQEGTTKLLAACKYQLQALEATKSLLTSHERLGAYLNALQQRKNSKQKRIASIPNSMRFPHTLISPSRGKVAVSDIRMPLIWKDSDHFKNRGDCRRFAVFCLLKLGTDVYDTSLLNNVDRSFTDVAFDDVVVFNHVPHDYEFRLEVYSFMVQEELTIANASNKLKKKISHSVSKAIGRKMVTSMKEDAVYKGSIPGMELVAHATLRLEDSNTRIKTYDLVMVSPEKSRQQLPLFGHFCCRMAVQPECMVEEAYTGYLSLVQQIGNLTGSRRMWCSLKNFTLSMWVSAADIHTSKPDITIPIKQGTKVKNEESANTYPTYSFRIEVSTNKETTEFMLAADTATELSAWLSHINQHIEDFSLWKPATDTLVDMPSPSVMKHARYSQNRNSSLYDETPFSDDTESSSPVSGSSGSPFHDPRRSSRLSTPAFRWSTSSGSSTSNSLELQTPSRPKSMYMKTFDSNFQF